MNDGCDNFLRISTNSSIQNHFINTYDYDRGCKKTCINAILKFKNIDVIMDYIFRFAIYEVFTDYNQDRYNKCTIEVFNILLNVNSIGNLLSEKSFFRLLSNNKDVNKEDLEALEKKNYPDISEMVFKYCGVEFHLDKNVLPLQMLTYSKVYEVVKKNYVIVPDKLVSKELKVQDAVQVFNQITANI